MVIRPVIVRGEIVGAVEESIVVAEWMAMQTEQVAGSWTGKRWGSFFRGELAGRRGAGMASSSR